MGYGEKSHLEMGGAERVDIIDYETLLSKLEELVEEKEAVATGMKRISPDEMKRLEDQLELAYENATRALERKLKKDGPNAFSSRDAFLLITLIKRALRAKARRRGGLESSVVELGFRMLDRYKEDVGRKHLQFNDGDEIKSLLEQYGLVGEDRGIKPEDLSEDAFKISNEDAA